MGGRRRRERRAGGGTSRRRAVPRRELLPRGGQRSGGSRKRGGTPMTRVPDREHRPDDVRGAGDRAAHRLPGCVLAGRRRHCVRTSRHRAWPARCLAAAGAAGADLGRDVQRHAARRAVLHVHGADPRAQRHGRGPARHDRPVVRADSRRTRLRGDLRRRSARRDHGRRGRVGDLDGPHLAADHAALRLRPTARVGRDRGIGNACADHPAVARADHHGRPARQVGGRHVRGRVHPRPHARGAVRHLCDRRIGAEAGLGAGTAGRGADDARAGRLVGQPLAAGADGHRRGNRRGMVVHLLRPLQPGHRDRRAHRHHDGGGHRRRVLRGRHQQAAEARPAVEDRRARHVRADPAARPHLSRAGHDLPGRGHADRGRRDGRDRRADHGARAPAPVVLAAETGDEHDGQAVDVRRLHPDRRARVQPHVLRRQRPRLGRASAHRASRRAARLPDRRQHPDLRARVLPRLLRAVVHHHSADRAGRGQARDRSHLVRRAARGQHADVVHASAVRLCALLPAQRRTRQGVRRSAHRAAGRRR